MLRFPFLLGLLLLLSGCISERHFARDSWPFGNPNAPLNDSETSQRALGQVAVVTTIPPQAGNVWPGAVQPVPTLSDIEKQQNVPLGQGYTPSLPSPYAPGQAPPPDMLPPTPAMPNGSVLSPEPDGGSIIVPAVPGHIRNGGIN